MDFFGAQNSSSSSSSNSHTLTNFSIVFMVAEMVRWLVDFLQPRKETQMRESPVGALQVRTGRNTHTQIHVFIKHIHTHNSADTSKLLFKYNIQVASQIKGNQRKVFIFVYLKSVQQ